MASGEVLSTIEEDGSVDSRSEMAGMLKRLMKPVDGVERSPDQEEPCCVSIFQPNGAMPSYSFKFYA